MRREYDLLILLNNFRQLLHVPFFDKNINFYIAPFVSYLEWLVKNYKEVDALALSQIIEDIWKEYYHFSGASARDIPYEIMYCISLALKQWDENDSSFIAPAIKDNKDYYFDPLVGVGQLIEMYTKNCDLCVENTNVVFIALPKEYKNYPLFCLPLYHELGHFIEVQYNIACAIEHIKGKSVFSGLPDIDDFIVNGSSGSQKPYTIRINYIKEFFADIFAACYIGKTMIDCLLSLDACASCSVTHPSTRSRIEVLNKFLAQPQSSLPIIDAFFELPEIGGKLKKNYYTAPNYKPYLDDCLPVPLSSSSEVHGLLSCGWDYIQPFVEEVDVTQINNLIEKSIRSYAIQEIWHETFDENSAQR